MKHMKKLFAMLMAMVMLVGLLSVTSFAAAPATYTITAPDNGHTYEVYQIFTGDFDGTKLNSIKWGTNGTGTTDTAIDNTTLAALMAVADKSDTEQLAVIQQYVTLSDPYKTVAAGSTASVPGGYYLIKDVNGALEGKDDAYTLYIVEVAGDVTIAPKGEKPTVQKKVDDKNDSNTTEDVINWQDSADYDIGDMVPYQLTGTLPSNYADYKQYYYEFVDTLTGGLTYQNDAKVYVVNGEERTEITGSSVTALNGMVLSVKVNDLKTLTDVTITKDSKIVVEYTAELNENAVIGSAGNPNDVYLVYSNNPNQASGGTPDKGQTPKDKVIVFTYQVVVNKVDEGNQPLAGATFKLSKKNADNTWKDLGTVATVLVGGKYTASWKGIDDGEYKLEETVTPKGYNTVDPIMFTVSATHTDGDDPELTSLTGGTLFTGEVSTGALTGDVINNSGSTLPETGGMGTYIFYAVGGVLVLAAAVLFVTKKRMSDAD